MLFILAWRNIWRNKTRSLIIMGAIVIGIVAALFLDAFFTGMIRSFIDNGINKVTTHIQIHAKEFLEKEDINLVINDPQRIIDYLDKDPQVEGVSQRLVVNGMLSTSRYGRGVRIKGIDPIREKRVCDFSELIIDGEYLDSSKKTGLLMGRPLAEDLDVKIGSKTILSFQDLSGHITYGLFRVKGVFSTGNDSFDEAHVFVSHDELQRNIQSNSHHQTAVAHEIAVLLKDIEKTSSVQATLQKEFEGEDVQSYGQLAPELELYESQLDTITWIYFIIIMTALIFGILNTMLMAVLERYQEFGVLQAIGMERWQTFLMVLTETLFICLVAIPIGLGLGYLLISYFSIRPIDLTLWSQMLEQYGMATRIRLEINSASFLKLTFLLAMTAVLASIYPAWKAMRLDPLEAINKI